MNERPKAIIFLVATAMMWSLGGLLIKSIDAHALAIAGGPETVDFRGHILYI